MNFKRLRRTDFYLKVGRPFRLEPGSLRLSSELRQQMVDEIMYQLARMLPPSYRGAYQDLAGATERYLEFI